MPGQSTARNVARKCTSVGEEVRHPRDDHHLGRVVAVAPAVAKPAMRHLFGQALDRPLARGVELEGDPHVWSALGVGDMWAT